MKRLRRPHTPIHLPDARGKAVIANEDVRVRGVVYKKGEMIPERLWNPRALAAAIRIGIVCRKDPIAGRG